MKILAIDTSCDETSAAVTDGRKILSNTLYSQIQLHAEYGGVMPQIARRAHEEHIDEVIERALKNARTSIENIDAIAVTYGPGLAIALGVGIEKAQDLAKKHEKKLIAVNHMEGHIYSCFAQNSAGNPDHQIVFPYLAVLVSGSHTEIVLFTDHITYKVVGSTLDDAVGEALDKAARLIIDDMVYPGGPVIERLALTGNPEAFSFPRPMQYSQDLNFSYSGLKTSLRNVVRSMTTAERVTAIHDLSASFQEAAFDAAIIKVEKAIVLHSIKNIVVGGGVAANALLRKKMKDLVSKYGGTVHFPVSKELYGDNAAMIGVAAYYHAQKQDFVEDIDSLERVARASL